MWRMERSRWATLSIMTERIRASEDHRRGAEHHRRCSAFHKRPLTTLSNHSQSTRTVGWSRRLHLPAAKVNVLTTNRHKKSRHRHCQNQSQMLKCDEYGSSTNIVYK